MYIRSIASVLIVTSSFILSFGQDTPTPPKAPGAPARAFSWSFDGGGSYLGVQTQEVNKDNFSKFGLRDVRGVAVEKVSDNSPAAAAGIQAGDVIVRFNGEEVTSARKLTRLIGEVDPDHQARVTILRNGSEQEVTATLAKRPMPKFADGEFRMMAPNGQFDFKNLPDMRSLPQFRDLPNLKDMPGFKDMPEGGARVWTVPNAQGDNFVWRAGEGRSIGVGILPLSKQLAAHFNVDGGALINDVRENSPAAKAGLEAGDIIVEAGGKAVRSQIDLIKAVNEKKEGSVDLTVVRNGKRKSVSVTPEVSKDSGFFFNTKEDGE
jgi:serine protease Do